MAYKRPLDKFRLLPRGPSNRRPCIYRTQSTSAAGGYIYNILVYSIQYKCTYAVYMHVLYYFFFCICIFFFITHRYYNYHLDDFLFTPSRRTYPCTRRYRYNMYIILYYYTPSDI